MLSVCKTIKTKFSLFLLLGLVFVASTLPSFTFAVNGHQRLQFSVPIGVEVTGKDGEKYKDLSIANTVLVGPSCWGFAGGTMDVTFSVELLLDQSKTTPGGGSTASSGPKDADLSWWKDNSNCTLSYYPNSAMEIAAAAASSKADLFATIVIADEWYQMRYSLATSDHRRGACHIPSIFSYPIAVPSTDLSPPAVTKIKHSLNEVDRYCLILQLCTDGPAIVVDVNYAYTNADGNHNTMADIPLVGTFITFTLVYGVFSFFFICFLVYKKVYSVSISRYELNYLVPSLIIKTIESSLGLIKNAIFEGESDHERQKFISYIQHFVSMIAIVFVTTSMIFFCGGYRVRKDVLLPREKRVVPLFIAGYCTFRTFHIAFGCEETDDPNNTLCSAFIFSYFVIFGLAIGFAVISLGVLLENLRQCMEEQDDSETIGFFMQYRGFQPHFFFYVLSIPFLIVVDYAVLTWRNKYVSTALHECTTIYILGMIATYVQRFAP